MAPLPPNRKPSLQIGWRPYIPLKRRHLLLAAFAYRKPPSPTGVASPLPFFTIPASLILQAPGLYSLPPNSYSGGGLNTRHHPNVLPNTSL